MGSQVLKGKHKFRHIEVVPGGASYGFGTYNTLGRTYFVNNITGSSANDGTTWDRAMAEPETAITASEVYRQDRGSVSTNDYIRNTIVIQGTGTAYGAVTAIPNYTDILGLGADPRGNGTGITKIDGAGAADALAVSSSGCRGLFMVNMQFNQSSAGSFYGADFAKLFRSRIEGCTFTNNGTGGLRIVLGGGVVIRDCAATNDTVAQLTGLTLGNGATVNNCKIVDCEWFGDTQGVLFSAVAGKQTVFKDTYAGGGTYGFKDTSSSQIVHQPHYIRCYGFGTSSSNINDGGFILSNNYASLAIACISNSNGTLFNYPTTTD